MPAVQASLEYLQKLPLYEEEKPYWCFLTPREGFDPDKQRVDNLEFEAHENIVIQDIRESNTKISIEECGFQVIPHETKVLSFETAEAVAAYKAETEDLLQRTFGAVYVVCYDSQLRKNVPFNRNQIDLNDPLTAEGPARGAHNDVSYDSGPALINRYISEDAKVRFMRPGFRFRILNTWRSILPMLEDRPLALCDSRSVVPEDLVAADRIVPDRVGEVYYLTYNPNHKWYWLENQTNSELFAFVMYDTKAGRHARFCPHVSFENPRSPANAAPRESIETRSIIVTME